MVEGEVVGGCLGGGVGVAEDALPAVEGVLVVRASS